MTKLLTPLGYLEAVSHCRRTEYVVFIHFKKVCENASQYTGNGKEFSELISHRCFTYIFNNALHYFVFWVRKFNGKGTGNFLPKYD